MFEPACPISYGTLRAANPTAMPLGPIQVGKMFFNILATFAEFEVDLLRARTREGMAVARGKGKLKGKSPKLTSKQTAELKRMHDTGDYSISDPAEIFTIGRATVHRTLNRGVVAA